MAVVRALWGVSSVEGRTRLAEDAHAAPSPSAAAQRTTRARQKVALPPLASIIAPIETAEANVSDMRPFALFAAVPATLDEPHPEAVRVWEPSRDDATATGAQMTQGHPRSAALETAAIAATRTGSAADCQAAVRAINAAVPVRFARGKSDLDGHSRDALDRLVAMAGDCPNVGLKVVGHADARGKAKRNLTLSQRRARAVVTYLIDKGIDAGRLEAVGYGEARPVAPNDTARNRAKNRRIELEITGASLIPQVSAQPTGQGAGNGLPDR
jgi:outer membrane protein OmpA-like peptidoglycan-associated protein